MITAEGAKLKMTVWFSHGGEEWSGTIAELCLEAEEPYAWIDLGGDNLYRFYLDELYPTGRLLRRALREARKAKAQQLRSAA